MISDATLQQIYDLPVSDAIRQNVNAFPVLESLHVLAVAVVFGTILIVDLRLLGVASHRPGVRRLASELLPYTWVTFALAAITGALMFASNAVAYAHNTEFLVKLAVIAAAGLNMAWFHSTAYRRIADWDENVSPPAAARIAGMMSLLLWIGVIFLGRWIGFTLDVFL
jgi:hypothetical protein